MPYTSTDYPDSWKNMTPEVRDFAIKTCNALLKQGKDDATAIRMATEAARHYAQQHQMSMMTKP